jgi:hypothetical protein
MDIKKCIASKSGEEAKNQSNLIKDRKLKCDEKLLFLYSFLEKQGINIYKYPNIIKNIRVLCNDCCPTDVISINNPIEDELEVSIEIVCSDNILAESFVIY